jgi:acetoin utilization deacetylase AcuC-like enzyme
MATTQTGYLFDERFLQHDTGVDFIPLPGGGDLEPVEHPSAARITRRTHALISGSGLQNHLTRLPCRAATEDDIALYHTRPHITRIRDLCAAGGGEASTLPGESTPVVPASYDVALLAAGGGMTAVDA